MTGKTVVLAVTACVSGAAHTYMAAEAIKEVYRKGGCKVIVETQGALGIENAHAPATIETADVVVFAADIAIVDEQRFAGRRLIRTDIRTVLKTPEKLAQAIARIVHLQPGYVMNL